MGKEIRGQGLYKSTIESHEEERFPTWEKLLAALRQVRDLFGHDVVDIGGMAWSHEGE